MKRLSLLIVLAAMLVLLFSCGTDGRESGGKEQTPEETEGADMNEKVRMLARITAVNDKIEVEVLESEYTFGPFWVITGEQTEFYGADGSPITRADLREGDTVEIYYSGQVMMSYPPQIAAHSITVRAAE